MTEILQSILHWSALLALPALVLLAVPMTSYRLGRHEVEVLIGGFVVRKVMLGNIDDVLVGGRFPCELWPSRDLFAGRFLSIRRKRGLFRYLVITPSQPDRLRDNIYYALGWDPKTGQRRSNRDLSPPSKPAA